MPDKNKKTGVVVQAILFLVVAAICVIVYFALSKRTDQKPIAVAGKATLDSLSITRWDVIPHSNMSLVYSVFKDSNVWKVRLQDHQIVDADLSIVTRSLRHLSRFDQAKSVKMDKSKWKAEGIDDNGNRVVVYEGDQVVGTYLISKLEFVDQYKASYYLRPVNSDSVYLLKETYVDGSIQAPDHNFRKRAMNGVDPNFYKTVKVVSPDTNVYYLLENVHGVWSISGRQIDQAKALAYIRMLSLIQIPEFATEHVKNPPEASVTIETRFGPVVLAASKEASGNWVLGSSVNIGNRLELTMPQVYAVFPPFRYFMGN